MVVKAFASFLPGDVISAPADIELLDRVCDDVASHVVRISPPHHI